MRCARIARAGDTGERDVRGGRAGTTDRELPQSGGVRSSACQDVRLTAVAADPTLRACSLQFPFIPPGKFYQAIVIKQ